MKSKASDAQYPPLDRVDLHLGIPQPLTGVMALFHSFTGSKESLDCHVSVKSELPESSLDFRIIAQEFTVSAPYAISANRVVLPKPDSFPLSLLQGRERMSLDMAQSLAIAYLRNTLDCLVQIEVVNPVVYSPDVQVSDIYHPYARTRRSTLEKTSMNAFSAKGIVYRMKSQV